MSQQEIAPSGLGPDRADNAAVTRSAFKVMAGGVLSVTCGLASQIVVAAFFGAGADMDAFVTALVIPTFLAYLLIGPLSFVLIPAFIREETRGSGEEAWALVGTFFWITAAVLGVMAIAGALFPEHIIGLTAPGFGPEKSRLASRMLTVLMFTVPLIGIGSLMRGLQSARGHFFWPSAAVGLGSLANVMILLILRDRSGPMSLAWGNLASAMVMAGVPSCSILRHGWKTTLSLNDPKLLELGRLILPFVALGVFTRSVSIFERLFASALPDGSISYLGYAYKISLVFVLVLAESIASAVFPSMARAYARSGREGLVQQSAYGMRLSLVTVLPVWLILSALSVPLVSVLFERGAFTRADTLQVSRIILIVLAGDLVLRMMNNIIMRTFYVLKDTLTFPLVSAAGILLYIPLGKLLAGRWGYVGLALAQPIKLAIVSLVVFSLMVKKSRPFPLKKLSRQSGLYLSISLISAVCAYLMTSLLAFLPEVIRLGLALGVSAFVYLALMFWRDREIAVALLEIAGLKTSRPWMRAFLLKYGIVNPGRERAGDLD